MQFKTRYRLNPLPSQTVTTRFQKSVVIAFVISMFSFAGIATTHADDKKFTLKTPTAFNIDLPINGSSATYFRDLLKDVSGGKLNVKLFNPGELIPAFEIHKAVSDGQVQAGYTCSAYLGGSLKESIPFCTFPFSPDPTAFLAWMYQGNGLKLYQKMYDDAGYNLKVFPLGIWAAEGAGWFTKKIEKAEDWQGIKIRIGGLAGPTVKKMGAIPTLVPFSEIFPGLEKGVIDAAEMGLPANDLRAGLYKVAKFYHMPSWHQPTTNAELVINKDLWNEISDTQRAQIEASVKATNLWSMTAANATQAAAIRELEAKGVEIVKMNDDVLSALRSAFDEVIVEMAAAHPNLKAVYDDLSAFMAEYKYWENIGMLNRQSAFD